MKTNLVMLTVPDKEQRDSVTVVGQGVSHSPGDMSQLLEKVLILLL